MTTNGERLKHETVMDVTEELIARVYAQAFMGAAAKGGNSGSLIDELVAVVTDVLDQFPDLEHMLQSSLVSHDQKAALLDRVLGPRASVEVLNFLKVLSKHGRLGLLRSTAREAKKLHAEAAGLADVEVRVATPLDDALRGAIEDQLRAMLRSEPVLSVVVDPALIAGIVIRVGDRVYDGSVATQLERTRQAMIERATENIDTHPEIFISTKER
jgi:F-type H+-transporting ATPase subunit delta